MIWKYNQAIAHNSLTQQGWERILAQSDDGLRTYLTNIKGTTATTTAYTASLNSNFTGLKNVTAGITQYNALASKGATEQQAFSNAVTTTNTSFGKYLVGLNGGKASLVGYGASLVGATMKTIGLAAASIALNAAVSMGVSVVITGLISAFTSWINKSEEVTRKAQEAADKINSINDSLKTNSETVEIAKKRYAELAQGVENLGKINQSKGTLSNDEYQEFLDLSNQLAGVFPSLTKNYDDNGNAILSLSGNVNTIVGSLDALINKEKELARQKMMELFPDVFAGYVQDVSDAENKVKSAKAIFDKINKAYSQVSASGKTQLAFSTTENGGSMIYPVASFENEDGEEVKWRMQDYISMLEELGIEYEQTAIKVKNQFGGDSITGYLIEATGHINTAFTSKLESARSDLQYAQQQLEGQKSSINSYLNTWLQTEFSYNQIEDTGLQNAVQEMLFNFDFSTLPDNIDKNDWEAVSEYLRKNILFSINNVQDNHEISSAISELFTNQELSPDQKNNLIKQIQEHFGKDNPITIFLQPQFEENETTQKQIESAISKFGEGSKGDLEAFFEKNSINTQEEVDEWNMITKGINNAEDAMNAYTEAGKNTNKIDVSLDSYKKTSVGISSLATAFNELTENEYISLESISKIKEAVGDSISNWDEYEQKLMSVKKGTAEYNQLVSELTYSTLEKQLGGVNALAQADEKYVAQLLKENGVLNANEVAHNSVERAKAKEWVQSQANDNITDKNIKSLMTEAKTAGISTSAYLELTAREILFNKNGISTKSKCEQILTLAKMAGIATTTLSELDAEIAKYGAKDLLGTGARTKSAQEKGLTVIAEKDRTDDNANGNGNLYVAKDGSSFEDYDAAMYYAEAYNNMQKISNAFSNINYELPNYAGNDSATQSFKESFNWIETALSRAQRAVTHFGRTVAATWQSWKERNAALKDQMSAIRNEISLQDQAYTKYTALAESVGLSEGYKRLVENGSINIETIESESIAEAIKLYQEYYEKALAARDASADLKDELAALAQTKFSNLAQSFADLMSGNEHSISMYEATIELMEKRGYTASASLYDSLKQAELDNQGILKEKYQSLSQALDEAVSSGVVVKYSEQWYQMQNEILAVEEAILQSNIALAEYDHSLRDLEWSAFDKLHEEISEIYEETEFLDKLLSDEKKFNEDGSMTEAGQAALGLDVVNYKTHLAQAEEYAQELEHIKEELAKDPYNQDLLERQDELEEKHRETLTNIEDDEQSMIDKVSEGYDTLLDHMDKMIDKRKNMLSQAKDLYEYEKNISKQTQEIASLEKQLAAYQGDDSEEARATIQKLQVSLSEAKENLEETEYEKYISDHEQMLDTLRLQTEEWINARLDNEDSKY